MATTTNYGWTTPDDTALVKDGAAAIRTLGSSVDTTTKALNPSTTLGDIEFRSSTANTNTRLGIGTSGQVLTVSGGVPAWSTISSGGITLLSTTTLSSTATTVSSIDQTYRNLLVYVYGAQWGTADSAIGFSCNISNVVNWKSFGTSTFSSNEATQSNIYTGTQAVNNTGNNFMLLEIDNYASTVAYKTFRMQGVHLTGVSTKTQQLKIGGIQSTTAVDSITFKTEDGYTFSAGTMVIYGVK